MINMPCYLTDTMAGNKAILVINKKDLRTKLHMLNTIGDLALSNISQNPNYFPSFCAVSKMKYYVLSVLLQFGHFSAPRSYRKDSYKECNAYKLKYILKCPSMQFGIPWFAGRQDIIPLTSCMNCMLSIQFQLHIRTLFIHLLYTNI